MDISKTALMLIDMQEAIEHPKWGPRNNPDAEDNMARLLSAWRLKKGPVFHIRHDSKDPASPYRAGQPFHAFKECVAPIEGEIIIGKNTNNGFIGTDLESELKKAGITGLIIGGFLIQHSVDFTARMASSLGFDVVIVSDGTSATGLTDPWGKFWFADGVHSLTIANFADDYGVIAETDDIIAAIESKAQHP